MIFGAFSFRFVGVGFCSCAFLPLCVSSFSSPSLVRSLPLPVRHPRLPPSVYWLLGPTPHNNPLDNTGCSARATSSRLRACAALGRSRGRFRVLGMLYVIFPSTPHGSSFAVLRSHPHSSLRSPSSSLFPTLPTTRQILTNTHPTVRRRRRDLLRRRGGGGVEHRGGDRGAYGGGEGEPARRWVGGV